MRVIVAGLLITAVCLVCLDATGTKRTILDVTEVEIHVILPHHCLDGRG